MALVDEDSDTFESASTDKSLMPSRTVMRVDKRLFYINLALGTLIAMVIRFPLIALCQVVVVHFVAMWITQKRPELPAIYLRYRQQADLYRAWISGSAKVWRRNRRPEGFGRI